MAKKEIESTVSPTFQAEFFKTEQQFSAELTNILTRLEIIQKLFSGSMLGLDFDGDNVSGFSTSNTEMRNELCEHIKNLVSSVGRMKTRCDQYAEIHERGVRTYGKDK
jgi:hypothetical protein